MFIKANCVRFTIGNLWFHVLAGCGRHLASPILRDNIWGRAYLYLASIYPPTCLYHLPFRRTRKDDIIRPATRFSLIYPHAIHWPLKHCCKHNITAFFRCCACFKFWHASVRIRSGYIARTLLRPQCGWNLHFAFMRGSLWAIAQVNHFSPTAGRWRCEEGRRQPINWRKSTGSGTTVRYGSRYSVAAV